MTTPPINTHVRLFDLVRYMRSELHQAELITDEEYSWLCAESELATAPEGGSPSPRRLEDYDDLRKKLTEKDAQIVALREAVEPFLEVVFVHPNDRRLAKAAKAVRSALSTQPPAVVPLEDVTPLVEAAENTRHWHDTTFNAETGKTEGVIVSANSFWKLKEALATFTAKHTL